MLSVTNPVGAVTSYGYDSVNRQTQLIEAQGAAEQRTTTTNYDAVGNVTAVTNPRGTVTSYVYDAINRRTQEVDAYGTSLARTLTLRNLCRLLRRGRRADCPRPGGGAGGIDSC